MAEITRRWCPTCEDHVAMERPQVNHVLHFLISMFTCGSWVFVWILLALTNFNWRCRVCGSRAGISPASLKIAALGLLIPLGALVTFGFLLSGIERRAKDIPVEPVAARPVQPIQEAPKQAVVVDDAPIVKVDPMPGAEEPQPEPAAEAKVDPVPETPVVNEARNNEAAGKLRLAKPLIGKNDKSAAKRLKEIIDKYDGTPAATEAAELLKKVE